jgi:methionyl-tRNA synthetase
MVLNFSLGQIKPGLPERAMTRDLDWGVPVPLDDPDAKGKVLYVWFDAPIGYVSFTAKLCQDRDGDWRSLHEVVEGPREPIVHFIGEDNTIFHALTWPAMLMAEGSYQLPWQVVVNAFLNIKFPGKEERRSARAAAPPSGSTSI